MFHIIADASTEFVPFGPHATASPLAQSTLGNTKKFGEFLRAQKLTENRGGVHTLDSVFATKLAGPRLCIGIRDTYVDQERTSVKWLRRREWLRAANFLEARLRMEHRKCSQSPSSSCASRR